MNKSSQFFLVLIPLTITTAILAEADNSSRSNLIFSTGFEQTDENGWNREVCSSCSHAINIVNSHARAGDYSARFILHKNDPDSLSGSKRTELARKEKEPGGKRERWYGFSIYLPDNYAYDPEAEIVTQWHATPDKNAKQRIEKWRSPPLALLTVKGQWQIDWRWDKQKITRGKPEKSHKNLGDYTKGEWTDWVFHVKWSYADNGLLEIWKNGQHILSHSGPIGYNDKQGVYMKTGIYKWMWEDKRVSQSTTTQRTLYIDEVHIGNSDATYKDVVPWD